MKRRTKLRSGGRGKKRQSSTLLSTPIQSGELQAKKGSAAYPSPSTTGERKGVRSEELEADGVEIQSTPTASPGPNIVRGPGARIEPGLASTHEKLKDGARQEQLRRREQRKALAPTASDDEDDREVEEDPRTHGTYLQNDQWVRQEYGAIWTGIRDFALEHFPHWSIATDQEPAGWANMKRSLRGNPLLARLVGLIAVGGSDGEKDWEELLQTPEWRRRIVAATIWRFLKERVFHALMFGSSRVQEKNLKRALWANRNYDGFARQYDRALIIQQWLDDPMCEGESINGLPQYFERDVGSATRELFVMLEAFDTSGTQFTTTQNLKKLAGLRDIVLKAAHLSLVFRINPDTIYHLPLTPKDDLFSDLDHLVVNELQMRDTNPLFNLQYDPQSGMTEARLKEEYTKSALVRVALMDACVAYRQGGWELPEQTEASAGAAGRSKDRDTFGMGFRVRKLARARVALRWGWQRNFDVRSGEKTDKGYVELSDLLGASE